jgi:hypothetical protein
MDSILEDLENALVLFKEKRDGAANGKITEAYHQAKGVLESHLKKELQTLFNITRQLSMYREMIQRGETLNNGRWLREIGITIRTVKEIQDLHAKDEGTI